MLGRMMDFPLTIPALLRRAAALFPSREIVSRRLDGALHRTTYRQVLERGARLGRALSQLGLEPGTRVATLCWNHHRHLEAYYGVPSAGLVLHALNLRLPAAELGYVAAHAEDRAILVDEELLPVLDSFIEQTAIRHVIVCRDGPVPQEGTALDYETLVNAIPVTGPGPEVPDELQAAAICYTSGTTGRPRGVVYSHRAMVLHTLATALPDAFNIGERDTILAAVPMFHANCWGFPYSAAMTGARQVLPRNALDPATLVDLLVAERVTLTAGVPTIWIGVLEELRRRSERPDLGALRALIVGGGACPAWLIRAFEEEYGIPVVTSWGMTELTPVGTAGRKRTDREESYQERTRPGRPLPLVETRIRQEGAEAPWDGNSLGELEVRGPWTAAGYYREDPDTALTPDGWFRTGDIATLDPDGVLEIRDRARDLIKSGGEWISSVALETALMGHDEVTEAAVIAIPHPKWQERPLAVVVRKAGSTISGTALRDYLARQFPSWYLPDRFEFVDQIPRTGSGKFKKAELRERYR